MEIKLAALADAANVSQEGTLNLLGIFNAVNATAFPSVHLSAQLVLNLEASSVEAGRSQKLEIVFCDADGNKQGSIAATFIVPKGQAGYSIKMNHIFAIPPMKFEKPGDYVFHIMINNEEKARMPLQVSLVAPGKVKGKKS